MHSVKIETEEVSNEWTIRGTKKRGNEIQLQRERERFKHHLDASYSSANTILFLEEDDALMDK
jgi:hypothetical protein